MSARLTIAVAVAALFVLTLQAHAAEQRVSCPLDAVQVDVVTGLPSGWWSTPQIGGVKRTSVKTIGGQQTLVCEYKYLNGTASVMRKIPAGMNGCVSDRSGFLCSTSSGSSRQSSGKSSSSSSSSGKSSSSRSSSSKSSSSRSSSGKPSSSKSSRGSSSSKSVQLTTTQARADVPVRGADKSVTLDTTQTRTNASPGTVKGSSSSSGGSCPDLAFTRVFVEQVGPDRGNGSRDVMIVAQLVNQGSENYKSSVDQQQVSIYEETPGRNPRQVAIEDIGGSRDGEMLMRESGAIRYTLKNWRASDEFPPSYRFQLIFDPDILSDGNSANDDCKAGNNEITIGGEEIIKALRRAG